MSRPCLHDGTCVEDVSGFQCYCHSEFSGPTCGIIQGGTQFISYCPPTKFREVKSSVLRVCFITGEGVPLRASRRPPKQGPAQDPLHTGAQPRPFAVQGPGTAPSVEGFGPGPQTCSRFFNLVPLTHSNLFTRKSRLWASGWLAFY